MGSKESTTISLAVVYLISFSSQILVWYVTYVTFTADPGTLRRNKQYDNGFAKMTEMASTASDYCSMLHRIHEEQSPSRVQHLCAMTCHVCKLVHPLRAGHSKMTNRCVRKYDHFCYFLWSDVGRNNYWSFYAFLTIMAGVALPVFIGLTTRQLFREGLVVRVAGDAVANGAGSKLKLLTVTEQYHTLFSGSSSISDSAVSVFHRLAQQYGWWVGMQVMEAFLVWCLLIWAFIAYVWLCHTWITFWGMTSREYSALHRHGPKPPYFRDSRTYSHSNGLRNFLDKLFPPVDDDDCY